MHPRIADLGALTRAAGEAAERALGLVRLVEPTSADGGAVTRPAPSA